MTAAMYLLLKEHSVLPDLHVTFKSNYIAILCSIPSYFGTIFVTVGCLLFPLSVDACDSLHVSVSSCSESLAYPGGWKRSTSGDSYCALSLFTLSILISTCIPDCNFAVLFIRSN